MSVIKSNQSGLGGSGDVGGALGSFYDYTLAQSLRFEDGDSAQLSRTPSSAGNQKTWTWSSWVKRGNLGSVQTIFCGGTGSTLSVDIAFGSSDNIQMLDTNNTYLFITTAVFRDTSAWYHIVVENDTTQADVNARTKLYVNGKQITSFSTDNRSNFAEDEDTGINSTNIHYIGRWINGGQQFDGYMAEVNFIDGTALDADNFGETVDGVWVPKEYTGSYGTNGFYLPFGQSDSAGFSTFFHTKNTSNIVHSDSSSYDIGSSYDFTVEFFFNVDAVGKSGTDGYGHFMGNYATGGPHFLIQYDFSGTNRIIYWYTNNGAAFQWNIGGDVTVKANKWHHIAFQRDGTTLRAYIDGTRLTTIVDAASNTGYSLSSGKATGFNKAYDLSQITLSQLGQGMRGYLSNVRFVIGNTVYADNDSNITVPTGTLSAITGTKLLTCVNATVGDDISSENNDGSVTSAIASTVGPFSTSNYFQDASGQENHFQPSGTRVTDVMPDSPTNNFCTLNPLAYGTMGDLSEGNLTLTHDTNNTAIHGTMSLPSSGKWYYEVHVDSYSSGGGMQFGWGTDASLGYDENSQSKGIFFSSYNEQVTLDNSGQSGGYGSTGTNVASNGDIYSVLLDVDNGKFYYAKNGTYFNSADPANGTGGLDVSATLAAANTAVVPSFTRGGSYDETYSVNFGQDSKDVASANADDNGIGTFEYAPPSGFLALCTSNLPDITIGPSKSNQADDFFDTILYTGNGNELAVGTGGMRRPLDTTSIAQSLRFNRPDEQELKKTFDSGGNRRKWTFSTWIKRTSLLSSGNDHYIFGTNTGAADSTFMMLVWRATDALSVTGQSTLWLKSTRAFQDTKNWYHIVWVLDSDNSTNAEKMRLYVNGTELTAFATDSRSSLSGDQAINAATEHNFGVHPSATGYGLDAYLAETIFVDGQAYGPEQFGQVGANDDWIPKAYSGGYGTTGFKLTYADGSALGDDTSGNTNDFTSANLDSTDKVFDSPTQNFATFDPTRSSGTTLTYSEGNLKAERTSTHFAQAYSNVVITEGKFYAEFYLDVGNSGVGVIAGNTLPAANKYLGQDAYTYAYYFDGRKVNNNSYTSYGDSYTVAADGSSDIVGVMINADDGEISFTKNGTVQNSGVPAFSGVTGPFRFAIASEGGIGSGNCFHIANFGQDDSFNGLKTSGSAVAADGNGVGRFYDTPPTGFLALMNDNLPRKSDVIGPDWVWIKGRSNTTVHSLHDTLRGTQLLQSNAPDGQQDNANYLLSFDSQGFTIGNSSNVNQSTHSYVGWVWGAGGTPTVDNSAANDAEPTAGSAKIDGSNQSGAFSGSPSIAIKKLSASTTAGFSIVRWTGTGSAGTIPHGLGATPEFIYVKNLDDDTKNWNLYPTVLGNNYLELNSTNSTFSGSTYFNNTAPTANVFSVGSAGSTNNSSDDFIAYVFAPIEGYSKFNSFTGTGNADGTFVYTGFRPAWVMIKRSSGSGGWHMFDNKRAFSGDYFNANNEIDVRIEAQDTGAENTSGPPHIDFVSNGFKLRTTFDNINASGSTYIYLAFAEAPFKFANAR